MIPGTRKKRNMGVPRRSSVPPKQVEKRLADDLDAMTLLQRVGQFLSGRDRGLDRCLDQVLGAAIAFTHADKGNIQVLDRRAGALRIAAQHGFGEPFLTFFARVSEREASSCGTALQAVRRTVVPDVRDSPIFRGKPALDVLLEAKVLAVQSTPLIASDGSVLGMISTHWGRPHEPDERSLRWLDVLARQAADFLQRRQNEEELREAEHRARAASAELRQMLDSAAVGVTRCSRDLRYVWANPAYARIAGVPLGRIVGQPIVDVMGREAFEVIRPHVEQVLSGRPAEYEARLPWSAVGSKDLHVIYTPWREADGSVSGWVASVIDVTERRRAERALMESDRRKEEFIAILAHELRNPLAPLRNALSILDGAGPEAEESRWARQVMGRQLGHMVRLIDDLLDVSRVSRGKLELRKERIPLAPAIEQTLEDARPLLHEAGLQIEVALPPEPVFLDADPTRLAQIVGNLLSNACKFTPRGGRVRLSAEQRDGLVLVRIADDGIGIPSEKMHGIFGLFSQADPAPEKTHSGLGIGLTMAKQLAELHGGSLEARSDGVGRGSEFVVALPAVGAPSDTSEQAAQAEDANPRRRILVVDDNRDSADSMALLLRLAGSETHVAYDGEEAIRTAAAHRPDVILLDIGLPGMNGYEVCRRIRLGGVAGDPIMVALTGMGQEKDRRLALEGGFDAHIVKPVAYETLMAVLADVPRARSRPGDGG
jgi:PAS domain S-box-containing protein